ncbi:hypothetical protein ACFLWZ_01995 [Chloroflexota bacterium]
MESDDARTLLLSIQQLRRHWAGVITSHFGYAIIINAAIWSYLLKAYVDSLSVQSIEGLSYVALAAALSAILLGLWRLYTHSIDNHIAGLYPDFLLCEGVLGIRYPHGTGGYLIGAVPKVCKIFSSHKLKPDQEEVEVIVYLVEKKKIGRRSHFSIDVVVCLIIIGMFVLCLNLLEKVQLSIVIGCLVATVIGFVLVVCCLLCFQMNPTDEHIQNAIQKGLND